MPLATWVLAVFTVVLAGATIALAYFTREYVKISKQILNGTAQQSDAINKLANRIQNLPSGFEKVRNLRDTDNP